MKELLTKYNLTAYALAKLIGAPVSTVSGWANGSRKPPEWQMKLIEFYIENHK